MCYGGDEFACVLPSIALAGGIEFVEHLRTLIKDRPCVYHATSISFTISLGVATLRRESGVDVTGLIRRADEQLLAAKRGGGDCVASPGTQIRGPIPSE